MHPNRLRPVLSGLALAVLLGLPATAQVALFDETALVRACSADGCEAALTTILTDLRARDLPRDEMDTQIGFLAALLLQSAESAEPARLPQIGAALGVLGETAGDPRQAAAIRQAAAAAASGQAGTIAASGAYAASPSRPVRGAGRTPPPFQSGRFPLPSRNPWSAFWQR